MNFLLQRDTISFLQRGQQRKVKMPQWYKQKKTHEVQDVREIQYGLLHALSSYHPFSEWKTRKDESKEDEVS